jgi:transcriptional regulator with XRE-family HTH domain
MLEDAALVMNLDARRRELCLSYELLSKRSRVSRPMVQRVLSGKQVEARFAYIAAIAGSLGLALRLDSTLDVRAMLTWSRPRASITGRSGFTRFLTGMAAALVYLQSFGSSVMAK